MSTNKHAAGPFVMVDSRLNPQTAFGAGYSVMTATGSVSTRERSLLFGHQTTWCHTLVRPDNSSHDVEMPVLPMMPMKEQFRPHPAMVAIKQQKAKRVRAMKPSPYNVLVNDELWRERKAMTAAFDAEYKATGVAPTCPSVPLTSPANATGVWDKDGDSQDEVDRYPAILAREAWFDFAALHPEVAGTMFQDYFSGNASSQAFRAACKVGTGPAIPG